jgi:D-3-phosphoglycerate dehydrogenase / 2-oxoglutarate reductase
MTPVTNDSFLVVGDHFIQAELMRVSLQHALGREVLVQEASTPFPLEPCHPVAEVREASGSELQMIDALRGVSICIAHHAPITERVIAASPALKLCIICRGGPVNVNVAAATAAGIAIGYTPGRNATATAEFTVASALAALRGIPAADAGIRAGEWPGDYTYESAGFELEGSVCGLVGYGAIGSKVARILRGFGAHVLVYDPYSAIPSQEGVEVTTLNDLLRRSRLVSLHARETPETCGLIGEEQIALMPRGSILVNCARGALLDYRALERALRSGHLFAAAADVFSDEPIPPGSSLLELPNLILTPHVAGGTRVAAEKAARIAAEEVARYVSGEPMLFCANPEVLERRRTITLRKGT